MANREWSVAMSSHLSAAVEAAPKAKGWMPITEIADEVGMTVAGMRYRMNKMIAIGAAEGKLFRVGNKSLRHYRLTAKGRGK